MRKAARGFVVAVLSCAFTVAFAAEQLIDIDSGTPGLVSYANSHGVEIAGGTLLPLSDPAHGAELWFSDSTAAGTRLFRDIFPGRAHSSPGVFRRVGGVAVFGAFDATHGYELWRSDGTAAGTYLLADIGPGAQSFGDRSLLEAELVGDVLYFAADDNVSGNELWRTDGTRAGTYRVADIVPGYLGSYPHELTAAGNRLFFELDDGLWITDGTSAGTRRVLATNVRRCCESVGNAVFFTANDGVHGDELWRVDADGQNPLMVANINTQAVGGGQDGSSDPFNFIHRGNSLLFVAYTPLIPPVGGNGSECRLYRVDANAPGVVELINFGSRCGVGSIINLPAGILFNLEGGLGGGVGDELFVSDGTPAGTRRLDLGLTYAQRAPGARFNAANGPNGEAYFFARVPGYDLGNQIWRTDGTRAGTRVFAELPVFSLWQEIAWLNGRLYFDAGTGSPRGDELWTTDGTPAGTAEVREFAAGEFDSNITDLQVIDGRLRFFASRIGAEKEYWVSDGTSAGTIRLGAPEGPTAPRADANVEFAAQLGTRAVFAADRGPDAAGRELGITDGTRAGTVNLRDVNPGGSADPAQFLPLGNQLLFVANTFADGRELWATNGTDAGTQQLRNIGPFDGNVTLGDPGTIIGGVAYFTAGENVTFPDLWRTDGTPAGTFQVPGSVGARVTILGGTGTRVLYHAFSSGAMHLWSWNGSAASVITAADSLKISSDRGVTFQGRVCFRATGADPRVEDVWCASGAAGDLVRATNLAAAGGTAGKLFVLGTQLLVNVSGGGAAGGLYATAGTAAGLAKISDERIKRARPFGATQLVFTNEGGELMITDGTSGGTRRLLQGATLPGPASSTFGVIGAYVVFEVEDPARGIVLWRTDGTPAGTRYVADLDPANGTAAEGAFFTLADKLLYAGYRAGVGNRIWSLTATDPNAIDDVLAATAGTAIAAAVLDNDADFDGTLNAGTVTIVTGPTHGTATVNASGTITYTATSTYNGADSLTYRVSDDQGRPSNAATLAITVTGGVTPPPNPPPNPPAGGGGGGGGALHWAVLAGLLLALARRRPIPLPFARSASIQ